MSLARATVSGIIIADPEKRFTPNNTVVTNFAIQVAPAGGRNDAPFTIRVTCWRNLAEVAASSLQKGMEVTIEGRLQVNQYEAQGGTPKKSYEIDASHIFIGQLQALSVGPQGAGNESSYAPQQQQYQQQPAAYPQQQQAPPAYQQAPPQNTMAPQQQQPAMAGAPVAPQWQQPLAPDDMLTEDDIPF